MREKVCFKCSIKKELGEFYKHPKMGDGHLGKCKSCTKRDVNARYYNPKFRARIIAYEYKRSRRPERKLAARENLRKMRQKHPGKARCRRKVNNAIRYGRIIRLPCEVCGNQKSEAHHEDYRSPLKVTWLCHRHHLLTEGRIPYEE